MPHGQAIARPRGCNVALHNVSQRFAAVFAARAAQACQVPETEAERMTSMHAPFCQSQCALDNQRNLHAEPVTNQSRISTPTPTW